MVPLVVLPLVLLGGIIIIIIGGMEAGELRVASSLEYHNNKIVLLCCSSSLLFFLGSFLFEMMLWGGWMLVIGDWVLLSRNSPTTAVGSDDGIRRNVSLRRGIHRLFLFLLLGACRT
jgi:hypothetical protein